MNVGDTNRLYDIVGNFVGLGDDQEAYARFCKLNVEDEAVVSCIIEELLLDSFRFLADRDRDAGLEVLERLAAQSREVQVDEWNAMLPPFPYPEKLNLFSLIHNTLTSKIN